jgi:hypothetical protein
MIEALKNVAIQVYNITDKENSFREVIRNLPREYGYKEIYWKINTIRNTIAHASSNVSEEIAEILSNEKKLIHWIKKGKELLDFLLYLKEQKGESDNAEVSFKG